MYHVTDFFPCLYSLAACVAFCILYNIRGMGMLICSVGGAFGWLVFVLLTPVVASDLVRYFFSAVAISAYAEIMARIRRCPVTAYLLLAYIPLVPGAGIYNMMEYCISGRQEAFVTTGLHTLGIAGALALGVLMVSSGVRMYTVTLARRSTRACGGRSACGLSCPARKNAAGTPPENGNDRSS